MVFSWKKNGDNGAFRRALLDKTFPRRKRGKKLCNAKLDCLKLKEERAFKKLDRQKLAFGIKGGQNLINDQAKTFLNFVQMQNPQ